MTIDAIAALRRGIVFGISVAVLNPCGGCGDHGIPVNPPDISGNVKSYTFSPGDAGKLPQNFRAAQTGKGTGGEWNVVADDSAPSKTGYVLAQTGEARRPVFNLCIIGPQRYRDLKLRVALKAVRGKVDQGGGLLWRCVDANNYYVCRYNPLEENLRIDKVIAGRRTELASAAVKLSPGEWHELTVTMKGDLIVADIDGTEIGVRDDTIQSAGQIGCWTKADAQTHFHNLTVTGTPQ